MKTAIFLSVREKATRLPKKVLLKIKGKTVTEHLIDRLKTAKLPDIIILCTSTNPRDDVLVDIAKENNIEYFRGSEDDKLDRYLNAALKFNVDFMVIVDGDDIFCDPEYIDKIIECYKKTKADCIFVRGLPLGAASTGLKLDALKKVCEIKDERDTEVWGGYFTETSLFHVEYIDTDNEVKRPEIRMTLDYPEDFKFFEKVFNRLYDPNKIFTLREIVKLIDDHPEIADINRSMNEIYLKNLKKHTKIKIKKRYLKK